VAQHPTQETAVPKNDMHRFDIIAELRTRGHTLIKLSRDNGYSSNEFARALSHSPINHQVAIVIARLLERELHDIWPSRYRADGSMIGYGVRNPILTAHRRKGRNQSAA
jgi:lambda repressor-like predicted transcriptional regulator